MSSIVARNDTGMSQGKRSHFNCIRKNRRLELPEIRIRWEGKATSARGSVSAAGECSLDSPDGHLCLQLDGEPLLVVGEPDEDVSLPGEDAL